MKQYFFEKFGTTLPLLLLLLSRTAVVTPFWVAPLSPLVPRPRAGNTPATTRRELPAVRAAVASNQHKEQQLHPPVRAEKNTTDDFLQRAFLEEEDELLHPEQKIQLSPAPSRYPAPNIDEFDDDALLSSTINSTVFPLDLVVGHQLIQDAIMIAAVNPSCSSLVIAGATGTCKSVLASSLQRLLHLTAVHVPVTVAEDSLTGSVDIEQSLETGTAVFEAGLLHKAHERILMIDDVNLLDEAASSVLLAALSDGKVHVEREGLSLEYPCRPAACVATYNGAYEEMREHVLDRFAMQVATDWETVSVRDRVQGVLNVESFVDRDVTEAAEAAQRRFRLEQALVAERQRVEQLASARALLPRVEIQRDQILYLCQQATAWDCPGQRAEIYAVEVARTLAALKNRTVVHATDLEVAVQLCIAPRGRLVMVAAAAPSEQQEAAAAEQQRPRPDTQPLPAPPDMMQQQEEEEPETEDTRSEVEEEEEEPHDTDEDQEKEEEEEPLLIPEEFHFGVDSSVKVDPHLLKFHKRALLGKGRRGGKRHRKFNLERGRFVKAIFPKGERRGRLAVGATLRAAAPYQVVRRKRRAAQAASASEQQRRRNRRSVSVIITKDDFRVQQLKKKTGSLVIFVVDASGSMALNRMSAAKGAAMALLQEAYKSRDKIAMIAFSGQAAEVVVPVTKSVALTRRRLEGMPCGSLTPLADALVKAVRIGVNAIKVKQDTGKVIIIVISDCRPNVPLAISEGETVDFSLDPDSKNGQASRKFLREEVVAIAKQIGTLDDFDLLCIDTEDKFVRTGVAEELARVAGGNYHALERADHRSIARVVAEAAASH